MTITWQTEGLTLERPVALINAGGGTVDDFSQDFYQSGVFSSVEDITDSIDTSGVTDPAPEAVYQSVAEANYGVGNALSYHLAVPDGVYSIRLDFAEIDTFIQPGDRVFDIQLQGTTVLPNYDIAADAGADLKATEQTFTVTATGGTGINLSLVNDTYDPAILSAIELYAANPNGVANPTVNIDVSPDGGTTWTSIAAGVTMDRFGRGSYPWTIPATLTPGDQYLIRVTADDGSQPAGVSRQPFLIADSSQDFYIATTGNDTNSGTSPNQPMATLAALLDAYPVGAGDTIHVAAGYYRIDRTIVLGLAQSGLTIEGPSSGAAIFDRGNTNPLQDVFELAGAANLTLENLEMTGGVYGIDAPNGAGDSGITVADCTLFDNEQAGAYVGTGDDGFTFLDNTIYGNPGSATASQPTGLDIEDAGTTRVSGNEVYSSTTGIYAPNGGAVISDNTVHDNSQYGIDAFNATITGNTVYGQVLEGAYGIYASSSEIASNVVYTNAYGIDDAGGNVISQNRLYNNSVAAIYVNAGFFLNQDVNIQANDIYSNAIGIDATNTVAGLIANNLDYANAGDAIDIQIVPSPTAALDVANNTIYQFVGNGISVTGTGSLSLANNIIWVFDGYDVAVDSASESSLSSDYNDLYATGDSNANVGSWGGTTETTLAAWITATGLDLHSISADPKFVQPAGADDALGYALVNGALRDAGEDDNFYLSQDSPAIDSGQSWSVPHFDSQGFSRVDDPGTVNTGSPDYAVTSSTASALRRSGRRRAGRGRPATCLR